MSPGKLSRRIRFARVLLACLAILVGPFCDAQILQRARKGSAPHSLANLFAQCDANGDGLLSLNEYLSRGHINPRGQRREFRVFDADHDERLGWDEFTSVPMGQAEAERGAVPDPVVQLVQSHREFMTRHWEDWDLDRDDSLDRQEFRTSVIGQYVPGLESTTLEDWDLNRDGLVHQDEVREVLELAFGIRTPSGEFLRTPAGFVIDWQLFRSLKKDADGFVRPEDYQQTVGHQVDLERGFAFLEQGRSTRIDFAQFAAGIRHRIDPAQLFLNLDADFNGRLSPAELDGLPPDHFPTANHLIPAFDDDRDGELSLSEFRMTPGMNPLAAWNRAHDKNGDGKLSCEEFQFLPGVSLRALSAEYFKRLDCDEDLSLSLDEFTFVTEHISSHEAKLCVLSPDGRTTKLAIPRYHVLRSPRLSPDSQLVALQGWEYGQNNFASQILLVDLDTDAVREVCAGYLPNWSPLGDRLAFSRYGEGVFIRQMLMTKESEQCLDEQAVGIQFAPDGDQVAYVKRNNIVVHDLRTGTVRQLLGENPVKLRSIEPSLAWSPDSTRISFLAHLRNGNSQIVIANATMEGGELRSRSDAKSILPDLTWHSDGHRLMFPLQRPGHQYAQIYELDPDTGDPPTRFLHQSKYLNNLGASCSRDGRTFVYVSTR